MRHIMVDNENVHWKKIPDLGEEPCCLWLFAGAFQSSVPTELTADLLELQKQGRHTVRLIQVKQSGENALDFCLSYHMGRIVKDYGAENVSFCVVSQNKGFDTIIDYMLSEKHCRHAVRVCYDSALRLREDELCEQIAPPQAANGQTSWQPPHYIKPDNYPINVSVGVSRAWDGLKQHPEARARSRSNLAHRLKEYVLKDWLTYPEPRRSQLVDDIITRLMAQGNIVQDGNGLLEYRMEYTVQPDERKETASPDTPLVTKPAEPQTTEPSLQTKPAPAPSTINQDDISVLIQHLSERERQQAEAEAAKRAALQAAKAALDAAKRPPPAPKAKSKSVDDGAFEAEIDVNAPASGTTGRLPSDDGHEWEPQRLLACARRMIDVCSADRLPERDTELIALFERAGLGRQYAQQALFLLIQNGDVAVEAGGNGYCLTYQKA